MLCQRSHGYFSEELCEWLQVVLPEGMAGESFQSAAGLQILSGEMMVSERTVEQVCDERHVTYLLSFVIMSVCKHAIGAAFADSGHLIKVAQSAGIALSLRVFITASISGSLLSTVQKSTICQSSLNVLTFQLLHAGH